MVTQRNNLFRKEALERTASPERLDQLVQVVSPQRWLSLLALGSLVAAGVAWSVLGRIPITVTGKGVLIYPSQVVTVQSPSSGRVLSLNVAEGDTVKKGQVLAVIDQSELENQLRLARTKLQQLQEQEQQVNTAQAQRGVLDRVAIAQQRLNLQQSLNSEESLTPVLRDRAQASIQQERQALQQQLSTLESMQPVYQERWDKWQRGYEQGAISKEDVLQVQLEFQQNQQQIDQVRTQLEQLAVKEAEAQQEYQRNLNNIAEIEAQLEDLLSQEAAQQEQDLVATTNRKKEIQETERQIAQLELELQRNSRIVSDYDGRVLELTAQPGERLEPGMGIGTIAAQGEGTELISVAFLPVSEGKKVEPDMPLQITPTVVKREEYGGIVATVEKVSDFPVTQEGVASLIGNPDVLPGVLGEGPHLAIYARLETKDTPSGYRWSASAQGPDTPIDYGMTTDVRITVEQRTPISYVIPILKEWVGMG